MNRTISRHRLGFVTLSVFFLLAPWGHTSAQERPEQLAVPVDSIKVKMDETPIPASEQSSQSPPIAAASDSAKSKAKVTRIPVVAISSLDPKGGVTSEEAGIIADNLAAQLQQSGIFRVMERSQMDQILKEQNFQQSGACDGSQCAVEMGKLLGIDCMVVGSIGKIGTIHSMSLRLVDVGTGEALRTSSLNRKGGLEDVLTELLPMAVSDLTGKERPKASKTAPEPIPAPVAVAPKPTSAAAATAAPLAPAPAPKADAPKPASAAATTAAPASEKPAAPEQKKALWPWVAGGVAVAAGGAAAFVLLSGKSSSNAASPSTSAPGSTTPAVTEQTVNVVMP